jgi:hypothetical protein
MTLFTHALVGYAISISTGSPVIAIGAALAPDVDHFFALRGSTYPSARMFVSALWEREDKSGIQRNVLHNVVVAAIIALVSWFVRGDVVVIAGYGSHLLLDMIDGSLYYPFFPSKAFGIRGFIPYFSWQELVFAAIVGLYIIVCTII